MIMRYAEKPLVYLRFLDHCQNGADVVKPIVCEVFGILKEKTDKAYIVCPWICDYNLSDSNTDAYCILRSTVIEYRCLSLGGKRYEPSNAKRHKRSKKTIETGNQVSVRKE